MESSQHMADFDKTPSETHQDLSEEYSDVDEEIIDHILQDELEEEREDVAASLYVNAVEFQTPPGKSVAIPVKQIVKIQQFNRNATQGGHNFYRVYTIDGHYTTAKSKYTWRDFVDHVFDPYALKDRLGPRAGRKDDLIEDED